MKFYGLVIAIMLVSNVLPSQGSPTLCTSVEDKTHDSASHADQTPQAGCADQSHSAYATPLSCSACGGTALTEVLSLPPMTVSASAVSHQPRVFTMLTASIWHPPVCSKPF